MPTTLAEITQAASDMATGMVKGNTADTLGAPVDLINAATKPVQEALGIYSDQPFGGGASFRKLFGMEVQDKNVAETAGSMISIGGAAKAMIVGAGRMEKLGKADLQKASEFLTKHPEVNQASVFNATGVYKGEEGGLRSILSDKGARLKTENMNEYMGFTNVKGVQKLEDILDHPQLFQAYPELKGIEVTEELRRGVAGSMGDLGMTLRSFRTGLQENETLSTILHEAQHGIQRIEGWVRGSSPSNFLPKDVDKTAKTLQTAVSNARQSADPSVQKAAERFKERFNNKVKDAQVKYENVPGEQEARFTQETAKMDAGQLGTVVLNMLRSGQTPQSFDTQVLPSVAAKNQATKQPTPESADLASAVLNMITNATGK